MKGQMKVISVFSCWFAVRAQVLSPANIKLAGIHFNVPSKYFSMESRLSLASTR